MPTNFDLLQQIANDIHALTGGGGTITATTVPTASELHLGEVGGKGNTVIVAPVLTVAGAYSANDYVGTSGAAKEIANAVRVAGGTATIQSCLLVDYALQQLPIEAWFFSAAVTPPADNAAWTISDADAAKCIGVVPFGTYYASALNAVAPAREPLPISFKAAVGSTSIWVCLVTRGAPTYATGDVTLVTTFLQD